MFYLKIKKMYIILIGTLLIILAYVTNITSIPDSLILFENEELNIKTNFGVKFEESIEVGANLGKSSNSTESKEYNLSLLGFNLKTITANIIPTTTVVPLGNLVGLKLYTKGVLVVGMSEIKGKDNKIYKPYEEAGIEHGEAILEVNNGEVNTTDELISCVSRSKGEEIQIEYLRAGKVNQTKLKPVKSSENTYKMGIWVRDAGAGVGTATFYNPSTNSVATLGHGIQDIDTGELLEISTGEIVTTEILDIDKGIEDRPGRIEGTIDDSEKIGEIYINTE